MSKIIKNLSLVLIVTMIIGTISCKRDISPELEVTVVDTLGTPANGAKVRINVDGANNGVVIPRAIDSSFTDQFGKAYFEFDNTILVDIEVLNKNVVVDSVSALCEVKRKKRGEDNVYERRLVFR